MTGTMKSTAVRPARRHRGGARRLVLGALALLVTLSAGGVHSQITGEIGDELDVGPRLPDMSFFSAEDVNLQVKSSDDVFAAGARVRVDGTSADHLVVAGGEISLRRVALEDLLAAGGEVALLDGAVADDVVATGGTIRIERAFRIGGSAVVAGGEVRIDAPVPADLRVAAGEIRLDSAVGGDARLSGEKVTLGPHARIGGNLLYRTDNLVIEPGAVITGERRMLPPGEKSALENWGRGAGELSGMLALAALAGFTLLVLAIAAAVPGLMRSTTEFIRTRPLRSAGIGILIALVAPFVIVLLFASVVGEPLALLVAAICLAITPVAVAASAHFIGMEERRLATRADTPPTGWGARLLWPVLGAATILLVGMIPVIGFLAWVLALLFGLGAVASRGGKALAAG